MTNLEFIEEKIENIKFSLERLKSHDLNDPYLKHLFEENNKDLNILEQIKTELEAWEVINNTFKIGVEEQIDEIYINGKNYYGNERTIWGYSKEGTPKIKKALEVEEDA